MKTASLLVFATLFVVCLASGPATLRAQDTEVVLTATSANVAEAGSPATIRIHRWSTEAERMSLVTALNPPPPPPARGAAAGDQGGGREAGGRAAAAGRGARGRGRGGAPAAPLSPMALLTAAIGKAATIGYIWTNDITGYSVKYAYRTALPDGGERIILATDRRLGAHLAGWTPVSSAVTTDEFTVIEIRMGPKGSGEGRTSLTTTVVVDKEASTIALENYAATPAILQNVKKSG